MQLNQLHHDFILENIIGDQMVACPFRKAGCDFVGQLQLLATHKKKCDFNPINLPSFLKKEKSPLKSGKILIANKASVNFQKHGTLIVMVLKIKVLSTVNLFIFTAIKFACFVQGRQFADDKFSQVSHFHE